MTSPAEDILKLLALHTDSIFIEGGNGFIGQQPELPHDCITVYDTGGGPQDSMNEIDDVSFMIHSRGSSYQDGWALIHEAKLILQSMAGKLVEGKEYVGVWSTSNIAFVGRDEKDRSIFSANFKAAILPHDEGSNRPNVPPLVYGDCLNLIDNEW